MPSVPPKGKPMLPGETRNPAGSSAKARAMAKIRRLSADDLANLTSMLLYSTRMDIKKVLSDEKASFVQQWTAKLLGQSYNKGDVAIYRAIMDRVVGTPKQTLAIGGDENGGPLRVEATLDEKIERLNQLRRAREERQKAGDES